MNILPRSAWGAAPPSASPQPWPGPTSDLVVHWVGGAGSINADNHAECPTRIRAIQSYEQSHGYTDIAYNLVCCPHGQVYEGRGLQYRGAANGPATNSTKPSVCLLLNVNNKMTAAMQAALLELNATVCPGTILGHREVNTTTCPGDDVFAWITTHRHATPTPPPPVPPEDDDMPKLVKCQNGDPMVLLTNSIHSRWVQDEDELKDLTALYGPPATWAPRDFYRPVLVGPAPATGFAGRPAGWPVR
jgi:hypothetical protein